MTSGHQDAVARNRTAPSADPITLRRTALRARDRDAPSPISASPTSAPSTAPIKKAGAVGTILVSDRKDITGTHAMPPTTWHWVKTSDSATTIAALFTSLGTVTHACFGVRITLLSVTASTCADGSYWAMTGFGTGC